MTKHFFPRQSRKKVVRKLFKAQRNDWTVQIERTNGYYASNLTVGALYADCLAAGGRGKDHPDIDISFKEIWAVTTYYKWNKAARRKEKEAAKKAKAEKSAKKEGK